MDYIEYKNASDRHLETCLRLRDAVINTYSKPSLNTEESKQMNQLLANIYYLSGYVIECIVSYGILKFIDFASIKSKNNITRVNELRFYHTNSSNKNYGVAYAYYDLTKTYSTFQCRWSIYTKSHKLRQNLSFFTIEAKLSGMGIRGIDVQLDEEMKRMLNKWEAEARYKLVTGYSIQKDKVFDFLNLAEHIHLELYNQAQKF